MYDYIIVGSGLYGATIAYRASRQGKKVLVIDKRNHIGGNVYTKNIEGIPVHMYGAHIFHTDYKEVWDFVNSLVEFNRYTNSPIAKYKNEIYNLPFNMNTFNKIWPDIITPENAIKKIDKERKEIDGREPENLEEQAISLVGRTIYEKLIKGYTEKQWNRKCTELPAFIIKRLPVRLTYNNNYFNDRYQGIPIGGYTKLVSKLLEGIEIKLNCNFFENREYYIKNCKKLVYTGMIDEFYDYKYGRLEYRSLKFDTKIMDIENFQGNAVVNYTDIIPSYTRVIEHKHFEEIKNNNKTIVTYEYPDDWTPDKEPYYVINDEKNNNLRDKYLELAKKEEKIIFGGRLAKYQYYDMDDIIYEALNTKI